MKYILKKQAKKIYFTCFQKKKKMSNGIVLTYLHQRKVKNDQLVVVFSSLTKKNPYAYNYVQTLKGVACHRLFILDNFGSKKRGVFYLGENGSMDVRDAVEELIRQIIKKNKIKTVIFTGTSKGGFAALYMGIRMDVQSIIVGSPIVSIKSFLEGVSNEKQLFKAMSQSKKDLYSYDFLLLDLIATKSFSGKIYLQYSSREEINEFHTLILINQLNKYKYNLETNEQTYSKHEDVRLFFPDFLRHIIMTSIGIKI
ncbi:accessory Sec system protein Asp2 [Listeria booriae]|uniref:Two component regulator three Y domain-containing protein n=1 Tax=Listeria booriae TaxID=1552123 RepID=A0A841XK10_9LIST|nr:accessory Sec system protein Asp2 [Listeria booriae]MBC1226722.1 hypothetical protein [Listeria booriae]MBC1307287.1 hypothetical protein [Listeria booriae]MBC1316294.1 hypothetical protein [Listeria booriae]